MIFCIKNEIYYLIYLLILKNQKMLHTYTLNLLSRNHIRLIVSQPIKKITLIEFDYIPTGNTTIPKFLVTYQHNLVSPIHPIGVAGQDNPACIIHSNTGFFKPTVIISSLHGTSYQPRLHNGVIRFSLWVE